MKTDPTCPTEPWKEVLHMHETPGLYMIHFALDFFDLSLEQLAELVMLYRQGGCDFWLWCHDSSTPFLRQLLIDLRDKVWGLTKENANLRASISEARKQLEQMDVRGAEEAEWRRTVAEKNAIGGMTMGNRVLTLQH